MYQHTTKKNPRMNHSMWRFLKLMKAQKIPTPQMNATMNQVAIAKPESQTLASMAM